ncbi:efflux transporter outer membrane subunit [Burkholderia sp. Cy-637]|uniref:efflux transporter outer membrane subunit n=1 Tax=Burkholderia sp. Cy-637 TaxID=2608327 RepID=UPI00141DED62|nr:efflux transporter outer membrane subunit [Burkholderia sp. Cy-637]NIF93091.1 efflux transporter outer membrane subunit [Burkholderia sp. Cy-637]
MAPRIRPAVAGLNRARRGMRREPARALRAARALALVLLAGQLAGCMLGPDYRRPDAGALGIPEAWHATLPHGGSLVELSEWWRRFDDPALSALIAAAQADNPNIDAAVARVREARAIRRGSLAPLLPQLNATGSFERSNGNTQAVTSNDVSQPQSLQESELNTTRGALEASWEIDLFGRRRRAVQAESARSDAAVDDWHDARVSVAADVADNYAALRECEALLEARRDEQRSRERSDALARLRVQAGFLSPTDAELPIASVAEGRNALVQQASQCELDRNALTALTGMARGPLDTLLKPGYARMLVPRDGAIVALPASSIEQRPDVRSAERAVAAASAEIGEARAARFPQLSLTGSIEVDRYHITGQSLTLHPWAFGPSLSLPVFDGGSGAANERAARARYESAMANYRGKVRQAVNEVENALTRVDASVELERSAVESERHYRLYSEATDRQFQAGSRDVLDVETARGQLIASTQSVAVARLERAQAWIALYRAIGGGWQEPDPALALAQPTDPGHQDGKQGGTTLTP